MVSAKARAGACPHNDCAIASSAGGSSRCVSSDSFPAATETTRIAPGSSAAHASTKITSSVAAKSAAISGVNCCAATIRSREAGKSFSAASAIRRPTPSSWRNEFPHARSSAGAPTLTGWGIGAAGCVEPDRAACIAQPLRTSRISEPSGERNSTASGIRPIACVEQLRHGSNVRTTASTRFSIPSAMCSPCT
jgi:hypothetical protein